MTPFTYENDTLVKWCYENYPTSNNFKSYTDDKRYEGHTLIKRRYAKSKLPKFFELELIDWFHTVIDYNFEPQLSFTYYEILCENGHLPRMIPHRDVTKQLLTMLVHLNDDWLSEYGGEFCIYDSSSISDRHKSIMNKQLLNPNEIVDEWYELKDNESSPNVLISSSVGDNKFYIMDSNCWHGSAPVNAKTELTRKTVLISFLSNDHVESNMENVNV